MGSKASVLLQDEELIDIENKTGFSGNQINRLYSRFTCLDKGSKGYLSREDFLRIPELAINPLGERIIQSFFAENTEGVNFKNFMKVLATFRPISREKTTAADELNNRQAKLRFAFNMYDIGNDNEITREELLAVLHMMVGTNISEEQLASIVDRTLAEADFDHDDKIGWDDFEKVMQKVDVEQKMSIRFLN
ncbi:DgyrCDS2048 [Dimorphilus gyrociliatus]|uniref:DgyrCDS2048 n=1 Tax=Dimorphilus gyrociliatus TaxID=2664684 RepID=A0A7I8V947_9ANNE|nr:DgyrCDS2048 [Dimorphilus gyrociliatus]